MSNEEIVALFAFIAICLVPIIGIVICESDDSKYGSNNRCVKNIILTYRIITNTAMNYDEVKDLFSESKTFRRIKAGESIILSQSYSESLIKIRDELIGSDKVKKAVKTEIEKIDYENIRMVDLARRTKRLKHRYRRNW